MSSTVPLIDRRDERERFRKILEQKTARLVTIQDRPGAGKSRLLQEFQSACDWEKIPASLTLVSIAEIRSPFDLVSRITGGFDNKLFVGFRTLDKHRVDKNFDAFTAPGGSRVQIEGSVSGSAAVADKIGAVIQAGGHVDHLHVEREEKEWSDDHERIARDECVGVFYEELRQLAREQPVVILLDEFEGCSTNDLHDWIVNDFLREQVFNDDQPSKLVVVIAGTAVPDLRDRLKGRHDELVDVIPELSRWSRDDATEFLKNMLGRDPMPAEVDTIQMWLDQLDSTIEAIVAAVKAFPVKAQG